SESTLPAMLIPIERGAREPLADQIVAYLRRAIEAGRLAPGAKLEPIRVLAKALGVNRETVAAAYRELGDLGLAESTRRRGPAVGRGGPAPLGGGPGGGPPGRGPPGPRGRGGRRSGCPRAPARRPAPRRSRGSTTAHPPARCTSSG